MPSLKIDIRERFCFISNRKSAKFKIQDMAVKRSMRALYIYPTVRGVDYISAWRGVDCIMYLRLLPMPRLGYTVNITHAFRIYKPI